MSKPRRSQLSVLAAALLLGALLLSCQPAQPAATPKPGETPASKAATATKQAEKAVAGGTLRVVLPSDPATLDAQLVTSLQPAHDLYDFLIELDPNLNVTKEGLLKDWTNSPDGKTLTFKLREGAKFQDGTDFDAAAVKFNIERMKDPNLKSPYRIYYDAVSSVDVVDSLTVRFNLSQPDAVLLARMGTQGGMVVSPAAVKKYGQDFGRNPVGSGPFQFVEWLAGDHITLKKFSGYWRKDQSGSQLPYLDQLVYKVIPDPSVGVSNLRAGQADIYGAYPGVPPDQMPLVKGDANLTFAVRGYSAIAGVDLNTVRPPFNNKALRQAVALAVDRDAIGAFFGEGATPYASILHPMTFPYDGKSGVFPSRDLAKAKAKMAEAGYSGGLKVQLTSGNAPTTLRIAEILKANMAEIGITAEIEALAAAASLAKVSVVGGDYQISPVGTPIGLSDPGHVYNVFFHSKGSRNYLGPYSNPQLDQLIDKAGSTYEQKERVTLYQQAANIIADDVPFVPTYILNIFTGMNKKVRNYVPYADGVSRYREVWLAQ